MRYPLSRRAHLIVLVLLVALSHLPGELSAVEAPGETAAGVPADPAEALVRRSLSEAERDEARTLFLQLAADDYDLRSGALRKLVAFGTPVLDLAKEFASNKNTEIATQARSLQSRILLQYDGYLPADPELIKKLAKPVKLEIQKGDASPWDHITALAKDSGVNLYSDPALGELNTQGPGRWRGKVETTIAGALDMLLARSNLAYTVRGDVVVITTVERAAALQRQRYTFDWKHLHFDRAEAVRVGEALRPFFPAHSTEMHTGSSALSIIGVPGCITRAARILKWLENDATSAVWPALEQKVDLAALSEKLAQPVWLNLHEDDLAIALSQLKKQGHDLSIEDGAKLLYEPPYPQWFTGLAPASLRLSDMPLGLALRWLTARAKFVGMQGNTHRLNAGVGPDGTLRLSLAPHARDSLDLAVGGIDARFLTPGHLPDGEKADEVILKMVRAALAPHLMLYSDMRPQNDIHVIRGRVLVKGSSAGVARALELIGQWQTSGQPPACAWHVQMESRLDKEIDWNGRGLRAGTLLKRLRQLGGFAVLLEPSADGSPPNFTLTAEQCALFEPSKRTVRALLDKLAATADAEWFVRWGVVVLRPKSEL